MSGVVVIARETTLDACCEDPSFAEVMDATLGRPQMVWLLLQAIRRYHDAATLQDGRGEGPGLERFVSQLTLGPGERNQAKRIVNGLTRLYAAHDPAHVRGAALERLVHVQIRPRYSGPDDLLDDNVKIELGPADARHQTSTSIDNLGWDGAVGEAHDCKVDPRHWKSKLSWLNELEEEVVPRGLAVGLVTADSRSSAERKLRDVGFKCRVSTLVPAESLHAKRPLLPLHP